MNRDPVTKGLGVKNIPYPRSPVNVLPPGWTPRVLGPEETAALARDYRFLDGDSLGLLSVADGRIVPAVRGVEAPPPDLDTFPHLRIGQWLDGPRLFVEVTCPPAPPARFAIRPSAWEWAQAVADVGAFAVVRRDGRLLLLPMDPGPWRFAAASLAFAHGVGEECKRQPDRAPLGVAVELIDALTARNATRGRAARG